MNGVKRDVDNSAPVETSKDAGLKRKESVQVSLTPRSSIGETPVTSSSPANDESARPVPTRQSESESEQHFLSSVHQRNSNVKNASVTSTNDNRAAPDTERPQAQQQHERHIDDICSDRNLSRSRRWALSVLAIGVMASLIVALILALFATKFYICNCSNKIQFVPTPTSSVTTTFDNVSLSPPVASPTTGDATYDLTTGITSSSLTTSTTPVPHRTNNTPFRRLSNSVWPTHYDLFFQPHLNTTFLFNGEAVIHFQCSHTTRNITLHIKDLLIDDQHLSLAKSKTKTKTKTNNSASEQRVPNVLNWHHDHFLQHMTINFDADLLVEELYALTIKFVGTLNDELAGFYRIKYTDDNGVVCWIAATQFEATDARRAFPCFDEPSFKATFSIRIKHWANMTALSNMPIIGTQQSSDGDDKGWVIDTFGQSARMSTYLVAFAITNFASMSNGNISVWARPAVIDTATYALKISTQILKRYEDFFGVEYPLAKMDMIALPEFNSGAMENWGLVTYRESSMLYDKRRSSIRNKQRVATVVAHELAHQWFGNLVTPKWWDDLWLNEGFASYVEYIGVDYVEPGWKIFDQFVLEEIHDVFRADSLTSSHQISVPVNNPDEIREIFDRISYAKGASIIRMMSHFLTEPVFRDGLRSYLSALRYDNAEQADLWHYLTRAQTNQSTAVDVARVMSSWTLQTGYPVVTLTRNYSAGTALLQQQRFQQHNGATAQQLQVDSPRWDIPITFTTRQELNWTPTTRLWMRRNNTSAAAPNRPSTEVEIDAHLLLASSDDWILVNVLQVGFYRVNYDVTNWRLILNQLLTDQTKIEPINRAQIIDDVFNLARNGMLDYQLAMDASKYLRNENNYFAWDTALKSLTFLHNMLERTPMFGHWKAYLAQLIEPFYDQYKDQSWHRQQLSADDDAPDDNDALAQYNRANAIAWSCKISDHCRLKARDLFDRWRSSGRNYIEPSLREIIYCNVVRHGKESDWDFLWRQYDREQSANERDRILKALACSRELWMLNRFLEWTFDPTKSIRRQDAALVFSAVVKNEHGRDTAFNFLRNRWLTIRTYFGSSLFSRNYGKLIKPLSVYLNTPSELQQMQQFYKLVSDDIGKAKRAFVQSIEQIQSNVDWMSNYYHSLENWMKALH
ncbi:Aminopeptidase N [Fragariocoptes setiger]|uniref:Aminopeptidase N n=1 Tax=Fragariocoptes setiger TaxID=1670756 RepID=A0ABQ7S6B8_9ACAR|nr:Aminopeptidase N [Fragariocoptes setiger]